MATFSDVAPDPHGNTRCQIEFLVARKFGPRVAWTTPTHESERQAYRDELDRMSLEPISNSLKQHIYASELDESKEVACVVFPAA